MINTYFAVKGEKDMKKRLLTILLAASLIVADTLPALSVQAATIHEETKQEEETGDSEEGSEEEEASEETSSPEEETSEEETPSPKEETSEEETPSPEEETSEEETPSPEEETSKEEENPSGEVPDVSSNELIVSEIVQSGEVKSTAVTEAVSLWNVKEDASGEGWSWDYETLTLTLTDLEMEIPDGADEDCGFGLPNGSTVVSEGTANSITGDVVSALYGCDLTIKGAAPLTLEGTWVGIEADDSLTVEQATLSLKGGSAAFEVYYATASDIHFNGCAITTTPCVLAVPTGASNVFLPMSAEGTSDNVLKEVTIAPTSDPYLIWTKHPRDMYSVKSGDAAMSITMTAEAELKQATGTVTYQWYRCEDTRRTNAEAISGETGTDYTLSGELAEGVSYYFCRATAAGVTSDGSVTSVYASPSGKWYPYGLNLGTSDITDLEDYGISYSYDGASNTGTLKLNNCTIGTSNSEPGINLQKSIADAGLNVELTGENQILGFYRAIYGPYATGELTFTGDGSLKALSSYMTFDFSSMEMTVKDQAKLTLESTGYGSLSNAVWAKRLRIQEDGKLSIKTNSELKYVYNIHITEYSVADFSILEPAGGQVKNYAIKDADGNVVTEAVLVPSTEVALDFTQYPKDATVTVGDTLTLEAKAELLNVATQPDTITYTWYNEDDEKLAENTTGTYTVDTAQIGIQSLYCVAGCTVGEEPYTWTGDSVQVVVLSPGHTLSSGLDARKFTADKENTAEGWSWKQETKTLTLNNFLSSGTLYLPGGTTLVIPEGTTSYIRMTQGYPVYVYGNLKIQGTGCLKLQSYGYACICQGVTGSTLTVQDVTLDTTTRIFIGGSNSSYAIDFGTVQLIGVTAALRREGTTTALFRSYNSVGLQATKLEKGSLSGTILNGIYNETTGFSEAILVPTEEPALVLADYPVATSVTVGDTLILEAKATLYNAEAQPDTITYTWYNEDDEKLAENTTGTYTVDTARAGITSFYCVAGCTVGEEPYTCTGAPVRVAVLPEGRTLSTGLDARGFTADKENTAEGWSWKQETKTLTLNNYLSSGTLYLPGGTTLVIPDGTVSYIKQDTYFPVYANGSLTMQGTGCLDLQSGGYVGIVCNTSTGVLTAQDVILDITIRNRKGETYSNAAISSFSAVNLIRTSGTWRRKGSANTTLASNTNFVATNLENGSLSGKTLNGTYNETTGYSEAVLVATAEEVFYLSKDLATAYYTSVGENLTLEVEASGSEDPITYTWYNAADTETPVGTGSTLVLSPTVRGAESYYCEAVSGGQKLTSQTARVVTAAAGKTVETGSIGISASLSSRDYLATKGWKWDLDTRTLTLSDFTSTQYIYFYEGTDATIVLEDGTENLILRDDTSGYAVGMFGDNTTITGSGKLTSNKFLYSTKTVTIAGGARVEAPYAELNRLLLQDEGTTLHLKRTDSGNAIYLKEEPQSGDFKITAPVGAALRLTGGSYRAYESESSNVNVTDLTLQADTTPRLSFVDYPASIVSVNLEGNLELTAEAKLVNSSETPEVTYTWYRKTDSGDEEAAKNTTGKLAITNPDTLSITDYYCVAGCETAGGESYSQTGITVTVIVLPKGRTLRTDELSTVGLSTQTNEAEGWSWNAEEKTLTLDYFTSTREIILPSDGTLVLKEGTVNRLYANGKSAYALYGQGSATITGGGSLELLVLNGTYPGIGTIGSLTLKDTNLNVTDEGYRTNPFGINGGIKIDGANWKLKRKGNYTSILGTVSSYQHTGLCAGTMNGNYLYGTYNAETGYTEMEFSTSAPWFSFTELSDRVQTAQVGGKVTLKAKAESNETGTITYQWFATDNWENPELDAVSVGSGASLTLSCKERGGKYYYCVASCKEISGRSDVICVVTAAKGKTPVLTEIKCYGESKDKLSEEGWKWDSTTETLTLSDAEIFRPFGSSSTYAVAAYWGSTIEAVEGTVNNLGDLAGIYINKRSGRDAVVTLKGKGTLNTANIISHDADGVGIKVQEGITANIGIISLSGENGSLTVEQAVLNLNGQSTYSNSVQDTTIKNGGVLIAKKFESRGNLVIEEGGYFRSGDYLCTGNVTIEKGGMLSALCTLDMTKSETSTLTVNGTLDLTAPEGSVPLIIWNKESSAPVTLGAGVRIVTPEGAELKERGETNYYGYYLGSSYAKGKLLIAEEGYAPTEVTKIGAITGKASYGQTLTAGALTPSGATVSYQWQYADTATGVWKNIPKAKDGTFEVQTRYAGKYLRVIATGYGFYTGQAVSAAVGPVEGNPATLTGIYLVSAEDQKIQIGTDPFDGDTFAYNSSWTAGYLDETCTVTAVPANEKAKITIENATNGFRTEVRSAQVPLESGENEIRITVSYNEETNVYIVKQKRVTTGDGQLAIWYYAESLDVAVTASWMDAEGVAHTLTGDQTDTSVFATIPVGTEITLTSTTPENMRAFRYFIGDIDSYKEADWTKEGTPYTFVLSKTGQTGVYIFANSYEYLAPETEADWLASDQNTIRVTTRAQVKTYSTDPELREYYAPAMELTTAEGEAVELPNELFTGVDADSDGYYDSWIADIGDLDSTKGYTVKAWCMGRRNSSYSSEEMRNAFINVEARKSAQLTPEKDYVVLKPGQSTTVDFTFDGYAGSELMMDAKASTDTAVVNPSDCVLTQKTESEAASIKITAGTKEGTTYLTVKAVDTVDPATGAIRYAVARIRVDVSSAETTEKVSLGVTSGSLNVYDDSAITVPVYRMNCGYPITGAKFADEAVAAKYKIDVVNDRTIRVTPVVPADSDTMDWAAWAKSMKGTYKSKVTIHYSGAESRTSEETLTIKAVAKAPAVKAAAVKCNSFFIDGTTDIAYTIKGAAVAYAKVDAVKNTAKTAACPEWLTLSADGKRVVLQSEKLTNNKASGKLYLKVWPEGWRAPAQLAVSVSAAYSVPKLKLSVSTINVSDTQAKFTGCRLQLVSGDKKTSLESMNVTKIRVANAADLAALSDKERKTYSASTSYQVYDYDANSGRFTLNDIGVDPISGKVLLLATIGGNSKQTIRIPLTVNAVAAPTLKPDKSSITLNTTLGTGEYKDIQKVTLTAGALGYSINSANTTITVTDSKGKGDYASAFDIVQLNETLTVSCTGTTTPGMTYKVTIAVEGTAKPAVLTVKAKADKPAIKLSKTSLTINRAKGYDYYTCDQPVTVATPSIKDYPMALSYSDLTIASAAGADVTEQFTLGLSRVDNQNTITIRPNSNTKAGTFKLNITKTLPDGSTTKTAVCTIKVVDNLPKVKLSASAITLNRSLKNYDKAYVELKGLDGYSNYGTTVQFRDSKGNDASAAFHWSYEGTSGLKFSIYNNNAQAGATYKAQISRTLAYGKETKPVTLTIKIAPEKEGKTPVTAKMSAKGTIDLTRPDSTESSVTLTCNGWNPMDYRTGDPVQDAKAPVLTWKVYAKDGKNPVTAVAGAIDDTGLVAWGSSDGTMDTKNWFVNTADVSANPYALTLGVHTAVDAWADGKVRDAYKYTLEISIAFPTTGEAVTANTVALPVKQGSTKFSQSAKSITLSGKDPNGRALLHIENIDKDQLNVAEIESVEFVGSATADALEIYEVTSSAANGKTYAIGWKDGTIPASVKSGSVKLKVFLKGNDPAGNKPNATITVTVNIK